MSVPLPGDLRYGLRRLNNNVGFTVVAVACLALGICASITVFSVADTLLLRPLPGVVEQGRIVSLAPRESHLPGLKRPVTLGLSYSDFERYQESSHAFTSLAAYLPVTVSLLAGKPLRLKAQVVSDNYFATLGLRPDLGRLLVAGEGARDGTAVVLSYELWQKELGGRRDLPGTLVRINGSAFVVAGVAPKGFRGTLHSDPAQLWLPVEAAPQVVAGLTANSLYQPNPKWLNWFFGRLAPGADLEQAQAEMDMLAGRFNAGVPKVEQQSGLAVYPGLGVWPGSRDKLVRPLLLAGLVVGLLMLVVCANLGGLLLVRAAARQEEIGVRLTLGVTRLQLLRQLLTESLVLAGLGGAAGFALALFAIDSIQGIPLGEYLPRIEGVAIDGRTVTFTLGLALGSGILFGLAPALWAARRQVTPLLRPAAAGSGLDRDRTRIQEVFVVGQIMVSLILLISTGLFVRTLWNLQSDDPGFESRHVLDLRIDLSMQGYTAAKGALFYDQLLSQARRLPGVESASLTLTIPLSRDKGVAQLSSLRLAGAGAESAVQAEYTVVSPGHFHTLGIPLPKGRDFLPSDGAGASGAVILDEDMAKRLWPGRNPIGRRVALPGTPERELEVVGVAKTVRMVDLQRQQPLFFYLPLAQFPQPDLALQVRTAAGDPLRLAAPLRGIIGKLDPSLAVETSLYEADVQETTFAQSRLFSWLLGSFSAVAVLITALGLYGALSYLVSRRTREMGIRMALGARSSEIMLLVVRRGMTLTLTGLVLGLVAASWTTSLYSRLLFGVSPTDLGVFAVVVLVLALVGLAASSLPAYSATRVDPMAVIRHE
ncbi:MAG TPA: ADOP family duplicated permease [Thermoanaerobaculia bacterium]|nr:ADOP family duplicated permease [Thermoanaerobaculia bacterium]